MVGALANLQTPNYDVSKKLNKIIFNQTCFCVWRARATWNVRIVFLSFFLSILRTVDVHLCQTNQLSNCKFSNYFFYFTCLVPPMICYPDKLVSPILMFMTSQVVFIMEEYHMLLQGRPFPLCPFWNRSDDHKLCNIHQCYSKSINRYNWIPQVDYSPGWIGNGRILYGLAKYTNHSLSHSVHFSQQSYLDEGFCLHWSFQHPFPSQRQQI